MSPPDALVARVVATVNRRQYDVLGMPNITLYRIHVRQFTDRAGTRSWCVLRRRGGVSACVGRASVRESLLAELLSS